MSTDVHTEAAEGFVCLVSHQQQQDSTHTHPNLLTLKTVSVPFVPSSCFCRFYHLLQWIDGLFLINFFLNEQVCHWAWFLFCLVVFVSFKHLYQIEIFGICFILRILQNVWIFFKFCCMCVNLRAESQMRFIFVSFSCVNPTLTGAMIHVAGRAHLLSCNAFFLLFCLGYTLPSHSSSTSVCRQWCGGFFYLSLRTWTANFTVTLLSSSYFMVTFLYCIVHLLEHQRSCNCLKINILFTVGDRKSVV